MMLFTKYLGGYCTTDLKLACFVCYLKIINTFSKANTWVLNLSKLSKEPKNRIEILVGQVVIKLWIKTVKIMIRSITQEPLGLLIRFKCHF